MTKQDYARLQPVCEASGRSYTCYGGTSRKDADGRMDCPGCGKRIKLRKQGLDRFPSTIPNHHTPRVSEPTKEPS